MMSAEQKADHLARRRAKYASDPEEREKRKANAQKWRLANPERKREANRRREQNNRDRSIEHKRRWKAANLDRVRETERARYLENRDRIIAENRLKKTGFTEQAFADALLRQDGRCAICWTDLTALHSRQVHADHCHKTNSPRGILCGACNSGIGFFRDDPEKLRAAIAYLESFGGD
jgi:hypothetical protein